MVAVSGSLSPDSSTTKALTIALESARAAGADAELIDLREYKLPFASSGFAAEDYPDVARFNDLMHAADAIIWGTPEYHGSFTGALKNAIDLGYEQYSGKLVALVGVAGGAIGAINALSHLRVVARQLHAWVLPQQVSVARAGQAFADDGSLKDAQLQAALENLGKEVARWARTHAAVRRESD